jgi:hypothetical protein
MKFYLKKPGEVLPAETCMFGARNGVFLSIGNDWVDAIVPADQDLAYQQPTFNLKIPFPGPEIFGPVVRLFHEVYKLHHSEAAVLLHFNMAEQTWAFTIPEQQVSAAHVAYEMTDRLPGHRCFGTMHSHGHMGASHSNVDTRDEANFDGLHVTIGNITKYPDFNMDAELVIRGHRFHLKPNQFPGIATVEGTIAWENRCVLEYDPPTEPIDPEIFNRIHSNTWRSRTNRVMDRVTEFCGLDVVYARPPSIPGLPGVQPRHVQPRRIAAQPPAERDDS